MTAFKTRLVWMLLALTLCQAWGAARHLHELEAARTDREAVRQGMPVQAASLAAGWSQAETEARFGNDAPAEETGDTDCHCLWCSPRLHTVVAYALPMPEPPPAALLPALLTAAAGFVPSPTPRGTVPPPRGPPA